MMLKKVSKYMLLLLVTLGFSCSSENKEARRLEDEIFDNLEVEMLKDQELGGKPVSEQAISEMIENISSPLEMAALILDLGVPFSNDYLATTKNADDYIKAFKKAINLGVFGADLGYLNMYNKTGVVMDYISTIKELADGIKVGQFFDFSTLKRLVLNNTNLDSLMLISQQSFNRMDQYLRKNNQQNLSTLIIAGVWIEGMFLATQVAKDNPHKKLKNAVGDQKTIIPLLLGLINNYRKDVFFKELTDDFNDLNRIYEDVIVTIEFTEPVMTLDANGVPEFKSAQVSIIDISDDTLNEIIDKTAEIRNKIISI